MTKSQLDNNDWQIKLVKELLSGIDRNSATASDQVKLQPLVNDDSLKNYLRSIFEERSNYLSKFPSSSREQTFVLYELRNNYNLIGTYAQLINRFTFLNGVEVLKDQIKDTPPHHRKNGPSRKFGRFGARLAALVDGKDIFGPKAFAERIAYYVAFTAIVATAFVNLGPFNPINLILLISFARRFADETDEVSFPTDSKATIVVTGPGAKENAARLAGDLKDRLGNLAPKVTSVEGSARQTLTTYAGSAALFLDESGFRDEEVYRTATVNGAVSFTLTANREPSRAQIEEWHDLEAQALRLIADIEQGHISDAVIEKRFEVVVARLTLPAVTRLKTVLDGDQLRILSGQIEVDSHFLRRSLSAAVEAALTGNGKAVELAHEAATIALKLTTRPGGASQVSQTVQAMKAESDRTISQAILNAEIDEVVMVTDGSMLDKDPVYLERIEQTNGRVQGLKLKLRNVFLARTAEEAERLAGDPRFEAVLLKPKVEMTASEVQTLVQDALGDVAPERMAIVAASGVITADEVSKAYLITLHEKATSGAGVPDTALAIVVREGQILLTGVTNRGRWFVVLPNPLDVIYRLLKQANEASVAAGSSA